MKNKKILFICLFLILLCSCSKNSKLIIDNKKEELINEIISYNHFEYDFLSYVYDNYDGSLEKIKSYFINGNYDDSVWHNATGNSLKVLNDNYNNIYSQMKNVKVINTEDDITISFAGDVSLADNFDIMPYYDSRGEGVYGILSTEVVDIIKYSDLMITNNEFTVSDRGKPLNKYYTFKAKPERLSIYDEMGVDLVSIANNHAYDYGEEAFFDMLKYLDDYDISYVGGGKNIDEAKQAFYYVINGYKFAFVSSTRAEKNIITPGAGENSSGVFRCYDNELLLKTIKEEKENSDFVILLIHWGREDSHELEDVQLSTGKEYIDAGADLIVGSHAHVLQGMDYYNNKLIAYNLGDFIFNRETKDTGILSMNIDKDGNINYEFIPCLQSNYKTTLLSENEKLNVIKKMNNYSINAVIDNNGKISSKY